MKNIAFLLGLLSTSAVAATPLSGTYNCECDRSGCLQTALPLSFSIDEGARTMSIERVDSTETGFYVETRSKVDSRVGLVLGNIWVDFLDDGTVRFLDAWTCTRN